jgi:3-deoxy-7-phosphoheptulonate synthase
MGNRAISGFMLESNLFPGSQQITTDIGQLAYGVSITDACIGWEETEHAVMKAYEHLSNYY